MRTVQGAMVDVRQLLYLKLGLRTSSACGSPPGSKSALPCCPAQLGSVFMNRLAIPDWLS